jgi:hypothetical protein
LNVSGGWNGSATLDAAAILRHCPHMKQPQYLLSVSSGSAGEVVTIHADRQGLEFLRSRLDALLESLDDGACDHEHFRSSDWAGFELTTSMLASERQAAHRSVHHLQVFVWTDEWKSKHAL